MTTRTVAHYMKDSHNRYGASLADGSQWNPHAARQAYPAATGLARLRFVAPVIAFIVTVVADIATTVASIHSGIAHEGDPLAAWVISHFGLAALTLPLIIVTVMALFVLHLAQSRDWRVLATGIVAVLWIAAVAHGVAAFSNSGILRAAGMSI